MRRLFVGFLFPRLALLVAVGLGIGGLTGKGAAAASKENDGEACQAVGACLDPEAGTVLPAGALMRSLSERRIVLLGERHDAAEHHRWQLQSLCRLGFTWINELQNL